MIASCCDLQMSASAAQQVTSRLACSHLFLDSERLEDQAGVPQVHHM